MTNPGPWTTTGQPAPRMSRTWWIVGGAVLAVVVVFVAFLAGLGWEEATEAETAQPATSTSEPARGDFVTDETGGRNPEQLREFHPDGAVLSASVLDELATSVCRALAAGAPPREVVDTIVATDTMTRAEATTFSMAANLEYCPDLA